MAHACPCREAEAGGARLSVPEHLRFAGIPCSVQAPAGCQCYRSFIIISHTVAAGTYILSVHGTKIECKYTVIVGESEAWICTGIYAVEALVTIITVGNSNATRSAFLLLTFVRSETAAQWVEVYYESQ